LANCLEQLHQQQRINLKRMDRMKQKIAEKTETAGITLEAESHDDVVSLLRSSEVSENLLEDSFRQLFWSI
jgi:flagellar biosynthesis/type III secretory pathway chaperone